ncbi:hypothetical protein [Dokdonia sp. R86516]|uniref:hypothetical protein n=1 Tax=Dokdonia sp. R86516 TaxID=3093856 RepID=UPI0037C720DC
MFLISSLGNTSLKEYPMNAIRINDLMLFLKILVVSKYKSDAKNKLKILSSAEVLSFDTLELLLKVISRVNNVRIKPPAVKLTLAKSDEIETERSDCASGRQNFN